MVSASAPYCRVGPACTWCTASGLENEGSYVGENVSWLIGVLDCASSVMGTGLWVSLEMLGERLMRFLALLSMSCRVIAYRLPGT